MRLSWQLAGLAVGALLIVFVTLDTVFAGAKSGNFLSDMLSLDDGSQAAAIADGFVDDAEYEAAITEFENCVQVQVPSATVQRNVGYGGKVTFTITAHGDPHENYALFNVCSLKHLEAVDFVAAQQFAPSPELLDQVRAEMTSCMADQGVIVDGSADAFRSIMLDQKQTEAAALAHCQREIAGEKYGLYGFAGF
jgi:hypothetical protein